MAKNKKPNPRRVPMSNAERVSAAREHALCTAWAIFFTVLADKEGYEIEDMQRVWKACEYLSDSIKSGRVNVPDLRRVLIDEYGIDLAC